MKGISKCLEYSEASSAAGGQHHAAQCGTPSYTIHVGEQRYTGVAQYRRHYLYPNVFFMKKTNTITLSIIVFHWFEPVWLVKTSLNRNALCKHKRTTRAQIKAIY